MARSPSLIKKGTNFYLRYENSPWSGIVSVISFISGFVVDSINPSRIDVLWNNLVLLTYVILAGSCIVIINLTQNGFFENTALKRKKALLVIAEVFFIGGLFSNQLIYYFQSSSGLRSFFFIAVLLVMVIVSEYFKNKVEQIFMQFAMYFLACFSFFTFFLPILTKEMNPATFLKGGLLSFIFVLTVLALSCIKKPTRKPKPFLKTAGLVSVLFAAVNGLYFMNWIPPVPLSLKHAGIYHQVRHDIDGYTLTYEVSDDYDVLDKNEGIYHYMPGDTVFCFAAVFAPTALNKKIFHRWQQFIPEKNEWIIQDRVGYQLYGGRDGGFRGYTAKTIITPGDWQIDIITDDDLLLGTVEFKIEKAEKRTRELKETKR